MPLKNPNVAYAPDSWRPALSVLGPESSVGAGLIGGPASAAWPTANLAMFTPFRLREAYTVTALRWANGSTVAGTNHIDAGIYNAAGARLASIGSTVQTGTSVVQSANLGTPLVLPPGMYYLAIALDNNADHLFRSAPGTLFLQTMLGCAQMASAFPLPSTATLATVANAYIPIMGAAATPVPGGEPVGLPVAATISIGSLECLGPALAAINSNLSGATSSTWLVGSRANFYPFSVYQRTTFASVGWVNGAAVSGNIDVGVYDSAFNRLGSIGSTLQAGTNAVQSAALALTLNPGLYYLAMVLDNATGTLLRQTPSTLHLAQLGCYGMSSAFPLPNPATPTATLIGGFVPLLGITTRGFW